MQQPEENTLIYLKVLAWARLNFEFQALLQKGELSNEMLNQLEKLGYQENLPSNLSQLVEDNGFFSCNQTSQRIASFTLKEIGINADLFDSAEAGIKTAYKEVNVHNSPLVDSSLKSTLETLSVFKP